MGRPLQDSSREAKGSFPGAPSGPQQEGRGPSDGGPLAAYKVPLYKDGSLGEGLWIVAGALPATVAARGTLLKSVRKLVEGTRRAKGGPRGGPQALAAAKADALMRRLDALAAQEG